MRFLNLFKLKRNCKTLNIILTLLILLIAGLDIGCFQYLCLPNGSMLATESSLSLPNGILTASVKSSRDFSNEEAVPAAIDLLGSTTEAVDIQILNGLLTVKSIEVQKNTPVFVIPGGQAIGILLQTDGVTVVGHSPIINEQGEPIYPAKDAGIQTGDFIISINGKTISYDQQVAQFIKEASEQNQNAEIIFLRDKEQLSISIKPQYCYDTHSYRIGLYVRDNTAGVGTLTFIEPLSGKYGALGHQISDPEGKNTAADNKGSIIRASIEGIKIGEAGSPGEKLGVFIGNTWKGTIEKNCLFGVFGTLQAKLRNPFSEAIPVATCNEVITGPAQIYTVLDGENIECFNIEIIKLLPNYKVSGKGMVIEITDEILLARTGGIVQGMSGSPIVQNGKLVGAVTHVFINDPKRGYGCMAQWMLEEAGLWNCN